MNPYQLKLGRIVKSLEENGTLLSEYERKLLLTTDPIEKHKVVDNISLYKQREEELAQDWEQANQRLEEYNLKQSQTTAVVASVTAALPDNPLLKHYANLS